MTEDMQVRNLSPHTQNSYVQQVSLFARHFDKSPEEPWPEETRAYQVYLTNERKLATSSILIAVSALRFLYKVSLKRDWTFDDIIPAPKKPEKLPIVLSPEEVFHFLECIGSTKHRAILTTCTLNPNFWRFPISTLSLLCQRRSPRSPIRRKWFTASSSVQRLKP
jgi:site-specific recombinase XerD